MISVGSNGRAPDPLPPAAKESMEDKFSDGPLEVETPFARPNNRRSPSLKKPFIPLPGEQVICSVYAGGHFVWSRNAEKEFRSSRIWPSRTSSALFMFGPVKSKPLLSKSVDFSGSRIGVIFPIPGGLWGSFGRAWVILFKKGSEQLSTCNGSFPVQIVDRILSSHPHFHLGQDFARVETLRNYVQGCTHPFRILKQRVKTGCHPPVLRQQ